MTNLESLAETACLIISPIDSFEQLNKKLEELYNSYDKNKGRRSKLLEDFIKQTFPFIEEYIVEKLYRKHLFIDLKFLKGFYAKMVCKLTPEHKLDNFIEILKDSVVEKRENRDTNFYKILYNKLKDAGVECVELLEMEDSKAPTFGFGDVYNVHLRKSTPPAHRYSIPKRSDDFLRDTF